MRGIAIALAIIVTAFGLLTLPALPHDPHGHAQHHETFYKQLMIPGTSMSCCNNRDCRPARYRITATGVEMEVAGRWIVAPQSRVIEHIDATQGHWCGINEHMTTPTTFCAVIPRGGV